MTPKDTQGDWRLLLRLIRIVREDAKALYAVLAMIPIGIGANLLQPYLQLP